MSDTPVRSPHCPVLGCAGKRPYDQLLCDHHWYQVPVSIRARVYATRQDYAAEALTLSELRQVEAAAIRAATQEGGAP